MDKPNLAAELKGSILPLARCGQHFSPRYKGK